MKQYLMLAGVLAFSSLRPPAQGAGSAGVSSGFGTYERWSGGRATDLNDPRWAVYNQRQQTDPDWKGKMAIEFYGQVVNENERPVADVTVKFARNDLSAAGTTQSVALSDSAGRFSLTGVVGKFLGVTVEKTGYYSSKKNPFGFEYAEFSDPNFYQPDVNKPVIFRIQAKGNAEALTVRRNRYLLRADGTPQYVNLSSGRKTTGGVPTGDIMISLNRGPANSAGNFDWAVTLRAMGAGGLVESHDEFMLEAPKGGYQSEIVVRNQVGDPNYQNNNKANYYIRLADGKEYASIETEIQPKPPGDGAIKINLYLNPSGSRNLEFDPAKETHH